MFCLLQWSIILDIFICNQVMFSTTSDLSPNLSRCCLAWTQLKCGHQNETADRKNVEIIGKEVQTYHCYCCFFHLLVELTFIKNLKVFIRSIKNLKVFIRRIKNLYEMKRKFITNFALVVHWAGNESIGDALYHQTAPGLWLLLSVLCV